jgi:hypothetical protein
VTDGPESREALASKNIRIPHPNKKGTPSPPRTMLYLGGQNVVFSKVILGFQKIGYDLEGDEEDV